jgi:hypothetical protein
MTYVLCIMKIIKGGLKAPASTGPYCQAVFTSCLYL